MAPQIFVELPNIKLKTKLKVVAIYWRVIASKCATGDGQATPYSAAMTHTSQSHPGGQCHNHKSLSMVPPKNAGNGLSALHRYY
jgi:hypothetical protein